jgi:hypothetical protein
MSDFSIEGRLEQGADGVALVVTFTGHPALATRALLDDDDNLRSMLGQLAEAFDAAFVEVES